MSASFFFGSLLAGPVFAILIQFACVPHYWVSFCILTTLCSKGHAYSHRKNAKKQYIHFGRSSLHGKTATHFVCVCASVLCCVLRCVSLCFVHRHSHRHYRHSYVNRCPLLSQPPLSLPPLLPPSSSFSSISTRV